MGSKVGRGPDARRWRTSAPRGNLGGMELHSGEHVIYEGHPSWRSILSFYLMGVVVVAVAVAIGAVSGNTGIGLGAAAVILLVVLIIGWLRRITTRYPITNRRLQ